MWAGDKRLIPPGGTPRPSQSKEIQGTLTHEAREGVASSASASRDFYDTTRIGRVIGNAGACKVQGAISEDDSKEDIDIKVGNANADESQGAIVEEKEKKIGNADVFEEQGAIIEKSKGTIGNAKANEETLGAIDEKKVIGNTDASGTQGAIVKKMIDNADANRTQGAITEKKKTIDNAKARSKRGAIYCQCQDKFEWIESIAKEGVGQSKICSGIHPRMKRLIPRSRAWEGVGANYSRDLNVSCPKEFIYFYLVQNIIFLGIRSSHKYF